ncbi:S26 family signal peptidase [Rhizobium leguminosarum]|uniref:S26 family signal peptidase n=1 Tax=Rhizobium leguminosarum TaxID=384 RepID=UPI00143F5F28|nr:S26 family signal peptidase [Rhizobium leguminosarum]MBY5841314.1 S26 family signal peptidase [Rhizobium leguminosarum]NKM65703.1 peptidase [Rhizobium leguminosarum bv. viciae]NKM80927.1 peptidase [Rhizobium leguminosarum bv. viciae]QSZ07297.1 S26 family signal peptidase [Rhizobium leguminosarum]
MTRFAWIIATCVSALFTTGLIFFHPQKKLIWNASASAPIGLYRIEPVDQLNVTDLAVVMPPDELASFLDQRGYLPKGVPLLKRVLALSGTKVCRNGKAISAYDMVYGEALECDSRGRPLPLWQGCITIKKGQAFFMNWDVPDSLDGRYFGALTLSTVIGRAVPLWTYYDPPTFPPTTKERQRP